MNPDSEDAMKYMLSNPDVPGNDSTSILYMNSFSKALIDEMKQYKWKPDANALAKIPFAHASIQPTIEELNSVLEPVGVEGTEITGSHLSYAEMKQIVHWLSYGAYPSPKLMEKCSPSQYNYLLGKHYEFVSKGKFVAPTEQQLEFHDPVVMTEVQKYKQELNNLKMKLESTKKKYEALIANPPQALKSKGTFQVQYPPLQQKSKNQSIADATLQAITAMFPNAATFKCKCPICGYDAVILNQVIHMNDNHTECTREYIADYLETLDVDLQIKENA